MRALVVAGVVGFGVLGAGAAQASPELQTQIEAGCRMSTNWSEAACACVASQAASLNDVQQTFLAMTMNQKQAEAAQAALQMTQAETMQASMFLATAGPGCQ
jgi:hypothetical protein